MSITSWPLWCFFVSLCILCVLLIKAPHFIFRNIVLSFILLNFVIFTFKSLSHLDFCTCHEVGLCFLQVDSQVTQTSYWRLRTVLFIIITAMIVIAPSFISAVNNVDTGYFYQQTSQIFFFPLTSFSFPKDVAKFPPQL